ncbi:MAG: VOC family protein [Geminicoccaceae bacterium]
MPVISLDHLVLTVRDEAATRAFYCDGLGMIWTTFGDNRHALAFGTQKINLHHVERTFEPKAERPTPGSADLCFLCDEPLEDVSRRMEGLGHRVIDGPVTRTGAIGPILSIYFRDPDGNLIEVSRPA